MTPSSPISRTCGSSTARGPGRYASWCTSSWRRIAGWHGSASLPGSRAATGSRSRSSRREPDPRRRHRAGPRRGGHRGDHRGARRAQAHRLGLPGPLPVPRRRAPQLRRDSEEGDVLLLRLPRSGRRVHLLHEEAGDGLPDRGARGRPPRRSHDPGARPHGPDPREPLFTAVATAADWFARQLRDSAAAEVARQYLTTRHVELEQAYQLGLGYAPKDRSFLDAMKGLGLQDEVLLEAGLVVKRDDGTVGSRFRGRLLFPIHDLRARVVAFGGRIVDEGEPKYLNSPDTPIFHKGPLRYTLHVAKHAMRKAERAILVEGYFDVLRPVLAGVEEVVAPLGTGLTPEQAQLIKRHAPYVILLYDSDDAGLRATFRAGDELLRERLRVSVATLPAGEDPDTLVRARGAAGLEAVLKDAVDVLERKIQILERKGFFGSLPGRRRALDRLLPTIRAARDPITRELYISRVAEVAGIRKDVLEREVAVTGGGRREAGMAAGAAVSALSSPDRPASAENAHLLLVR